MQFSHAHPRLYISIYKYMYVYMSPAPPPIFTNKRIIPNWVCPEKWKTEELRARWAGRMSNKFVRHDKGLAKRKRQAAKKG